MILIRALCVVAALCLMGGPAFAEFSGCGTKQEALAYYADKFGEHPFIEMAAISPDSKGHPLIITVGDNGSWTLFIQTGTDEWCVSAAGGLFRPYGAAPPIPQPDQTPLPNSGHDFKTAPPVVGGVRLYEILSP